MRLSPLVRVRLPLPGGQLVAAARAQRYPVLFSANAFARPYVSAAELELAERLIRQSTVEKSNPLQFIDPARQRILDAARRKLAGGEALERPRRPQPVPDSAEVVDLLAALRASLASPVSKPRRPPRRAVAAVNSAAAAEAAVQRQRRRG